MARDISEKHVRKIMNNYMIKIWGAVESPASEEFEKRGTKIDLSKILKPTSGIVDHCNIDGVVVTPTLGRGYLEVKNKLQINENDIVLASYPKTGTTWVQEIIYSLLHRDELDKEINESIDIRVPFIEFPECGFQTLLDKPSPKYIKTHLHYNLLPGANEKKFKVIATTRNPKDTAVSLFHFLKMMNVFKFEGDMEDVINMFLSDCPIFGPFWRHVLSYWENQKNGNVLVIKYEDLHNDIRGQIKKIAKFLEIAINEDIENKIVHRCGFEQMASNPSCNHAQWTTDNTAASKQEFKFMRKGKIGDWKNHLNEEQNRRFDAWIEKNFSHSDLKYQYE